jgi:hypothetical protein
MRRRSSGQSVVIAVVGTVVIALVMAGLAPSAEAATLFARTYGTDSPDCGPAAKPCRTINRAIQNAEAGDKIVVGRGRYGAGETPATACDCLIQVDKKVRIESDGGADATVIASPGTLFVVSITANNVVFGVHGKGFTVTGGLAAGVNLSADDVAVAGNHAIGNGAGFAVSGSRHSITRNSATNNGSGNASDGGFLIDGTGHDVTGNVAIGNNPFGFNIESVDSSVQANLAMENLNTGFALGLTNLKFTTNAAINNGTDGITISFSTAILKGNNIFGNGVCGVNNQGSGALDARGNFWGAPTGPGPDPADDVCNLEAGDATQTVPFATREFSLSHATLD